MRTKHFILILGCVVVTTIFCILFGPVGQPNDSFKSIVTQTHQQINKLQENLRVLEQKQLDIDPKYLAILGFTNSPIPTKESQYNKYNLIGDNAAHSQQQQQPSELSSSPKYQSQQQQQHGDDTILIDIHELPLQHQTRQRAHTDGDGGGGGGAGSVPADSRPDKERVLPRVTTTPYNGTKTNFSIVTYVQDGQAAAAILLSQNIAARFPSEYLLIYDLGLSEEESRSLSAYCNSTRCSVIGYDLSVFPSYVSDQRMHAFRPIVIKDALMRSKCILFAENFMRFRGSSRDLYELHGKVMVSGVLGWNTPTAVSTRTHPKMFEYFQTDADDFIFLRMIDLDVVLFADSFFVTDKILLPWIKCALTLECIDPIGAQWNGCKYNKKPQYRYSGCHGYDASAFNIVLGLTWPLDDSKYALPSESSNIFYKETLEQATKILENRRRNSSETSEHPFTED